MNFGPSVLAARLAALVARDACGADARALRVAVALSGGADSAALLHAAASLARESHPGAPSIQALRALHVDHGLQSAAGALRTAAANVAAACRVPLDVLEVRVDAARESVEAAARDARYAALARALAPGEWLLTAHHVEDQAETLLLQLLRGAGLRGLAAMPARATLGAGEIVRPLLDVPRSALVEYARAADLPWCDDPMNSDPRFDRAYLRAEIWPRLLARWPAAATTIARTAAHAAEAQSLLDAQAESDLVAIERGPTLHVPSLLALDERRRAAAVRYWLVARHRVRLPTARRLALLDREVLRARGANGPRLAWDGVELRRHDDALHLVRSLPDLPAQSALWPGAPLDLGGLGRLVLEPAGSTDGACRLSATRVRVPLSVRPRSGGERLRLAGAAHRRPLKDLLREARVPPWLRDRVPVLWDARQIVAVVLPDRTWVDASACAAAGESGYLVRWHPPPAGVPGTES